MPYTVDFETTTDTNDCRVWATGICCINNPDIFIYYNNIDGFFAFASQFDKETFYFHNLKFDGEFILLWLFENGFEYIKDRKKLCKRTFTTLISDRGVWYSVEIMFDNGHKCIIYDSLKILPLSVDAISKAFNLPVQKLVIDYAKHREIGYKLTQLEIDYLKNDVKIMSLALSILFSQGLTKMTQGSNALYDYKKTITTKLFNKWFPIQHYEIDKAIRKSYKGGFVYCNPDIKGKDINEGIVLDVNSLYPSRMYYCAIPYGEPIYFKGMYCTNKIYNTYIQNFNCIFELKDKHIPSIQLKNNISFLPTEYVTSSKGEMVSLCLTNVDLELFMQQYDIIDIEYIDGWMFKSSNTMFRDYIDKWNQIKIESTINKNNAMRTLAKLMLNSLYGKFGLNPNVCSKIPYYNNGKLSFTNDSPDIRNPIYIPAATFITAYARYTTITSAQKVYDRFLYADTDSLHLSGTDLPDCLDIDNVKLGAWKHEATFTRARYLRQKSYIEEIDGKLEITCAGMPKQCYDSVTWDNFKTGSSYEGKLRFLHVRGGIVLVDTPFTIKK